MSPESPLQQLRVGVTARERYPEGRYAWDNRDRTPHVIVQRTEVGRGWFEQNGRRAEIVAGQAFICEVPSATSYGAEPGAPYALEFLTLHGVLAMRLAGAFRSAFGPVVALSAMPESCSRFRELVRLWSERRLRDPFDEAIRLFELFASLHREASRAAHPADPVAAVHERIRQRFREPLTIKEFAAAAGISREHLSREFRRRFGQAPASLLRQLRLREARELLATGGGSLATVARAVGFNDERSLARLLKNLQS